MPNMKRITLKDPVTGDILIPTGTGLGYELTPDAPIPPYEVFQDAATLEGHPATDFPILDSEGKVPSENLPAISSSSVFSKVLTIAGWVMGSDDRYYQTINVDGVTPTTKIIIVDIDLTTDDADAKVEYLTAWAGPSANEVTQGNGTLTFYSYDLPTVNIPIFVGVNG